MKIIVAHNSPDWDAIMSIWLLKRFLAGWQDASVEFVPAGQRSSRASRDGSGITDPIEPVGSGEMIHVDTGMGPLDHHQIEDDSVSAASLTWNFVKEKVSGGERWEEKKEAIDRIVRIVVDIDHFKEVFWDNPAADYHEFSLIDLLDGLKLQKQDQDLFYVTFGMECLDAILHNFENRIWAEKEIAHNGLEFTSSFGKGMGFETINDSVLRLAQKMGYVVVVRKDPRKGYARIKARPPKERGDKSIDLTLAYEKLKKMDPEATWYLHVSKRMLLNGTTKNPDMRPTTLTLGEIINVLKGL